MKVRLIVITTLLCVLGIVTFLTLHLMQHEAVSIDQHIDGFGVFSGAVHNSNQSPTIIPAFTNSVPVASSSVFDWSTSHNIKHASYIAPATNTPVTTATPVDVTTPSTEPEVTEEDPFALWSWFVTAPVAPPVQKQERYSDVARYKSYGNTLGSRIQTFVIEAGDQNAVLADFVQNRNSESTHAHILQLATAYESIGKDMLTIPAPEPFAGAHTEFAEQYAAIGMALRNLSQAETDTDTLKYIYAYNAQVDNFAQSYLQIANLFAAFEVSFTTGEGGDIFSASLR